MRHFLVALLLSACLSFGQQNASSQNQNRETPQAGNKAADGSTTAANGDQTTPHKADKSAAYYHFTMAHMYEEEMAVYGRSDLLTKAIQEYRLAIEADPSSQYLTSGLAEL